VEAHGRMKKSFAYATIAAFLGVVIMLAPFLIVPAVVPATQEGKGDFYGPPTQRLAPANTQAEATQSELAAGVTPNYPVDVVTLTLILLLSLSVAFSAYVYARRNQSLANEKILTA